MAQRVLEPLTPDECLALLRTGRVGRLVYHDDVGPVAEPVNYAMAGTDIVFRVEGGAKREAVRQPMLAFEVDHVDDDQRSGWSVIVRGAGREVPMEEVPALMHRLEGEPPRPWALGVHNVWLQITPHTMTGRRLGDASSQPSY